MRVIAGKAKGRKLRRVPGETTRPITDRVKENLFNILGDWVIQTRWLDLFAGTGQVGIEALSRGADEVLFIDNTRLAIKTIYFNLEKTDLLTSAQVIKTDSFDFLDLNLVNPFDVIFVAPPQYLELWSRVLAVIDRTPDNYMSPDGMIIVQIDPREYFEADLKSLQLFDQRRYGNTMLCFYEGSSPTSNSIVH
ncbi:MAG TPA: 16S rRNA (guanine(966)-N(2))-methyltransferase RsmD [Patescibacteria group bacterium]|nr:16S rRNA (guanine(966)-N(2))-methyltransferase RsmD [Patescibacteria group bacterium]